MPGSGKTGSRLCCGSTGPSSPLTPRVGRGPAALTPGTVISPGAAGGAAPPGWSVASLRAQKGRQTPCRFFNSDQRDT